jgi:hypothetical protein
MGKVGCVRYAPPFTGVLELVPILGYEHILAIFGWPLLKDTLRALDIESPRALFRLQKT